MLKRDLEENKSSSLDFRNLFPIEYREINIIGR